MKISASVYSHTNDEIDQIVHNLEQIGVDYFHVDCNDEPKVFDEIALMRKHSNKPIDLHLITSTPDKYWQLIQEHKPDFVCFQYEELPSNFEFKNIDGVSFGLAIKTDTPISVFETYKNQCDFILLMATTPGKSGGTFDAENFKKVRSFMRYYPAKNITVDGGVNAEVSFVLRSYGVATAVVGSYLAQSNKRAVSLNQLKYENTESHFKVADMMVSRSHLPILKSETCTLESVLKCNEDFRLGYTLIENAEEELIGISTNADIRRALLKRHNSLQDLVVEDVINSKPKTINEHCTITEMLDVIKNSNHFISYMPVLSNNNKLKGAINLHFLIKGEL
ncbi:MAG: CBS domain-containing protein [Bacteroidia bacterium]